MVKSSKQSKNLLPLLAVTGIFLSVALVNFNQLSEPKDSNTQSVLSKSVENRELAEPSRTAKPKSGIKTDIRARVAVSSASPSALPMQKRERESLLRRMWLRLTNNGN